MGKWNKRISCFSMIYISKAVPHSNSMRLKWQECLADILGIWYLAHCGGSISVSGYEWDTKGHQKQGFFLFSFSLYCLKHSPRLLNFIPVNIIGYLLKTSWSLWSIWEWWGIHCLPDMVLTVRKFMLQFVVFPFPPGVTRDVSFVP